MQGQALRVATRALQTRPGLLSFVRSQHHQNKTVQKTAVRKGF
ncbi:hypothetical protein PB1A_0763 [Leuconostoc inhae]|uniref:Uncharacterized protein n=1 Tax=Leuconostoc inhae TaxID=178001 RepID=A0AAN2QU57_9LACO|nr:hypothetical protein KSL4_1204 [Leuconostoc inhae]CUW04898.1 hypothetical protein PL111_0696 [Leuconostoc inhae]CUW10400.1 hypothetical protein PB1A_0763 [Leuconostoc inhae]